MGVIVLYIAIVSTLNPLEVKLSLSVFLAFAEMGINIFALFFDCSEIDSANSSAMYG
ncbi:MAG: hypothetical protein CM1200mP38_3870 [Dehalococcoidia bacterium]|nr:MAG: hypothetical protein CM1200mP38_3870 [Dehalococcoidia bacterium]